MVEQSSPTDAELRAEFAEVLREADEQDAWDHDFTPNPYDPWRKAALFGRHGARAVPILIEALASDDWPGKLAAHALAEIGPAAAPAAVGALARATERWRGHALSPALEALMAVDRNEVLRLGLHRRRDTRDTCIRCLSFSELIGHEDSLCSDPDWEVVVTALGALSSRGEALLEHGNELDSVRSLLGHGHPAVRSAAAQLLVGVGDLQSAGRLIEVFAQEGIRPGDLPFVAPHPTSLALVPVLSREHLWQLVRRRRAAGLPVPPAALRARICEEVRLGGADAVELVRIRSAILITGELRDHELLDDLIATTRLSNYLQWDVSRALERTLPLFGRSAKQALDAAAARPANEQQREHLGGIIRRWKEGSHVTASGTLDRADALFVEGKIDLGSGDDAFDRYAEVLLCEPENAHAGIQLAWIDRAFGVPACAERVAFLWRLGVRDEDLLAELASAAANSLMGFRSTWSPNMRWLDGLDQRCADAGLPGLAAALLRARGDDVAVVREELEAAARAHLARVARAAHAG